MSAKALREKRGELYKELRRLADLANDKDHDWSAEDEENWGKVNKDYDALSSRIERLERADSLGKDQTASVNPEKAKTLPDQMQQATQRTPTAEDRALYLQAWLFKKIHRSLRSEHETALERLGVTRDDLDAKFFDFSLRGGNYQAVRQEYRAQSTTAGAGGETIPQGFVDQWEFAMLAFGGVRQVADVIRTASGNALPWPTTNDTGNVGALLAENTQVSAQDISTSSVTFNAYKYTSKLVLVSHELIEDSAFNISNELGRLLAERIARALNAAFTTGTGSSQPNGIVTAATVGVTAASTSAITTNELIDLMHSVDPAYRPGATWMMNDSTVAYIRKIVDGGSGTNQYMWQPGLQAGQPDRLLGFPIVVNQQMASIGSLAKPILFGLCSKYKIRDVASLRLLRLVERYADYDQEGFVAFSRHDGDLLDAGTNPVKVLQHPS